MLRNKDNSVIKNAPKKRKAFQGHFFMGKNLLSQFRC